MNSRNTKQKYIILNALKNKRTHPTIQELYEIVKQIDPTIGQATVYRNIKKFVDCGKINVIKNKNGIDRYDYYKDHIHFECLHCGRIVDIIDNELLFQLECHFKNRKEKVLKCNLMLEGYCTECINEN